MNIQPEESNNMNGIGLSNGNEHAADFSHQKNTDLDTEGYTPTYDEAFPELPVSNAPIARKPGPAKATSYSGSMQAIRASTITQVTLSKSSRNILNLYDLYSSFLPFYLYYICISWILLGRFIPATSLNS